MIAPDLISAVQLVGIAGVGGFVLNMINLWQDSKKPKFKRAKKDLQAMTAKAAIDSESLPKKET